MENHSTATCKHTLPLETVGLFYSLKSHNILQVLPLVVHCPRHDTTLNTLDTSSLGSSTGSGLVMAWTGDRLQTAGATGSQSLARAGTWMQCQGHPEELLLLHQQQKTEKRKHKLIAQWGEEFDGIETDEPMHPMPSLPQPLPPSPRLLCLDARFEEEIHYQEENQIELGMT